MTNEIWGEVQEALKQSVGEHNYKTWICPIEFDAFEDGVAHFCVPTNFIGNYVGQNFSGSTAIMRIRSFSICIPPEPRCAG